MDSEIKKVMVSREEIYETVKRVGREITEDYKDKIPLFVGILKGAVPFLADLIRVCDLDLEIDFMSVKSYGSSSKSTGEVRILKDLDYSVQGKDIIIVEDIIDSGYTLKYLKTNMIARGAKSVRIAAFLDKAARRVVDIDADYVGKKIENEFIVGYGMDYAEKWRGLADICALKNEVYEK